MSLISWRIFKPRHAATAFTGKGARLYGGRWNSKGTAVVYTAQSVSLAMLELLVHLPLQQVLKAYRAASATFDEALVETLDRSQLPTNWRADPAPVRLRQFGDEWVASERSAILCVPSAIYEKEYDYLLNPAHPDFARIVIGKAEPFRFDPRLANGRRSSRGQ